MLVAIFRTEAYVILHLANTLRNIFKMSSQYFEDLEEEISQLLEDVRRIIESSLPLLGGGQARGACE